MRVRVRIPGDRMDVDFKLSLTSVLTHSVTRWLDDFLYLAIRNNENKPYNLPNLPT